MSEMASSFMGAHDCPCVTMDKIINTTCFRKEWVGNFVGRTIPFDMGCLEPDFGIGCGKHFLDIPDLCDSENVLDNPKLCDTNWCFIDEKTCFHSNQTSAKVRFTSNEWPLKYYSISTCRDSFGKENLFRREDYLYGAEISVLVPSNMWPYYYLSSSKEAGGEDLHHERFNETHFVKGVLVDFLNEIKSMTNIKSIEYFGAPDFPSNDNLIGPKYVQRNIVDLSIGPLVEFPQALAISSFSMPILPIKFFIYELEKSDDGQSFLFSFRKMFEPFDSNLCYTLIICVFLVALLNICLSSPSSDFASWHQKLNDDKLKKSHNLKRLSTFARIHTSSLLRSFNECFGNASEIEERFSVPHKFVAFGFGFFILIISSSYTANLATFLSYTKGSTYISSMKQAIDDKVKFCIPSYLEDTLQDTWPNARFVPLDNYKDTVFEAMKSKKCDAIIGDKAELLTMPDLCNQNLVTNVELYHNTLALPIKLSLKNVFDEAANNGIHLLPEFLERHTKNTKCLPDKPVKEISHNTLGVNDLMGPIVILSGCMIIGIFFKMRSLIRQIRIETKHDKKNDDVSSVESLQRVSFNNGSNGANIDFEGSFIEDIPNSDRNYDLLVYKYQLELIHAQVELAQSVVEEKLHARKVNTDIVDAASN